MIKKKYEVPEGMLKAAGANSSGVDPCGFYLYMPLEAALRWLSENPIVPTDEQFENCLSSAAGRPTTMEWQNMTEWNRAKALCVEWQRQMFLAPELEAPEKTNIVYLLDKRMAEYSDWLWENLDRAAMSKKLLPRLEWDKPKRKVFTYGDVAKPEKI